MKMIQTLFFCFLLSTSLSLYAYNASDIYESSNSNIKCEDKDEAKELELRILGEYLFYERQSKWIIIPESKGCVKPHTVYTIIGSQGDKIAKARALRTIRLEHILPYRRLVRKIWDKSFKESLQLMYPDEYAKKERFIAVNFEAQSIKWLKKYNWQSAYKKKYHFYKRIIEKKEIPGLLRKKWLFVDVKKGRSFIGSKIKKSILVPYRSKRYLRSRPGELIYTRELGREMSAESFNVESLKKHKDRPIVVYGINQFDDRALRALAKLRMAGFTDIYWYKGGTDDWLSKTYTLNYKKHNITSINLDEAKKKFLSKKVKFIDVRTSNWKSILYSIHVPYKGRTDYYYTDDKSPSTKEEFIKEKNNFDIKNIIKHKDKELVLYGWDDKDSTPLRAAIWLKEEGFTKVSVYTGGIQEWLEKFVDFTKLREAKKYVRIERK